MDSPEKTKYEDIYFMKKTFLVPPPPCLDNYVIIMSDKVVEIPQGFKIQFVTIWQYFLLHCSELIPANLWLCVQRPD